jgi:hypothetical protein
MAASLFNVDIDLAKNQLLQARFQNSATAPTGPADGQVYYDTTAKKFYGWNSTIWVDLSVAVANAMVLRGEITIANTSPPYPASPAVGDVYIISTNAGFVGGQAVEIGDELIYSTSGWFIVQKNLQAATNALAGFVRLALQTEVNAGADLTTAVTPGTLAAYLIALLYTRKYATTVASLPANTATTITHGLNLATADDFVVNISQGGQKIQLAVAPTTVNAFTITSNQALTSVRIVVQG